MKRPNVLTVFGILNIVFAALGLLGILASIALFSLSDTASNPVAKIIQENPTYATWMKISIPLGLCSCFALLAAGVGLLMVRNWGRMLSIGYSIYAVLMGLAGTAVNFKYLVLPMIQEAAQKQGPEAAGAMGGAVGGAIGGLLGLIYPVLLLIFMTRPKIVAAMKSPPPLPPV